ncbi:MAG: hypothetical protein IJH50_14040 [Kiritimatiellae bacterium]|nr:hypothetical protein [Kiritimatiellia bacterium]
MSELLYPAYQKLYSALCNLERFDKETNFFDNISSLDGFFSEYRNITFVLQAQVKHMDDLYAAYLRNRDLYLKDHWFVDKRNETTKEHSFKLVKKIQLTLYLPDREVGVFNKEFSVENDKPLDSLLSELKEFFAQINQVEVFFSVRFSFHEKNSDIDLLEKLVSGISSMLQFMEAMERDTMGNGILCDQLKAKITGMKILLAPRDFLLVDDYVYYPCTGTFDKGSRLAVTLSPGCEGNRLPLASMIQNICYGGTPFDKFTFMHAFLCGMQPEKDKDLMPVIMTVYGDGTYDMNVFHASIKTTMYRKINEIARHISSQDVKEVFYMSLYSYSHFHKELSVPATSKERIAASETDFLVCACINERLEEKEYVFDGREIDKPEYVAQIMKNGMTDSLHASRLNLHPIWQAFSDKQKSSGSKK